jgi:O-antigen/teichoic acid export membrane protein
MRDIARIGKNVVTKSARWMDIWILVKKVVIPATLSLVIASVSIISFTELGGVYKYPLLAVLGLIPLVLVRKYVEAICLGMKEVVRSIIGSQIIYPLLMVVSVIYIWYFGVEPSAFSIAIIYSLSLSCSLVASLLMIYVSMHHFKGRNHSVVSTNESNDRLNETPGKRRLFQSGIYFSLISLGFILTQHVDVLIMGMFATPEEVGLVRIAARVAEMTALMRAIIVMHYKPRLAEAYGKSDFSLIKKNVGSMVLLFVVTGAPLVFICFVFSEQVLSVFGSEFVAASNALKFFVIGIFITLILGPGATLLSLSDHEKIASRNLGMALVVQVILDILLIPKHGLVGCGVANMIALVTFSISNAISSKKRLNIDPSIFGMLARRKKWMSNNT